MLFVCQTVKCHEIQVILSTWSCQASINRGNLLKYKISWWSFCIVVQGKNHTFVFRCLTLHTSINYQKVQLPLDDMYNNLM